MISAYIRVKNEIKTIEACLNSIDGVFDKIVIIHSHEKDDGSIAFMNKWCQERKYCEIHEYPYDVIPSHDARYKHDVNHKNTFAAYYNFGLQFFQPEEWVVKIDADQVYIKPKLEEFLQQFKNGTANSHKIYGLTGYNTFVLKDQLIKYRNLEINGGSGSFIIKRKNILHFKQHKYYEVLETNKTYALSSPPVWFHFQKNLKSNGKIRELSEVNTEEIIPLSIEEKTLFEEYIRPLLINSPYYKIR